MGMHGAQCRFYSLGAILRECTLMSMPIPSAIAGDGRGYPLMNSRVTCLCVLRRWQQCSASVRDKHSMFCGVGEL